MTKVVYLAPLILQWVEEKPKSLKGKKSSLTWIFFYTMASCVSNEVRDDISGAKA